MDNQPVYVSVQQAADFISVSQRTIRRYIDQGHLPAYRVTGTTTIRIKRDDLEALLQPIDTPVEKDKTTA